MVEIVVALVIIVGVMASMATAVVGGLIGSQVAKEHETATELVNKALEQVRALPYQTITTGLSSNDPTLATDPNLVQSSGTYTYNGETVPVFTATGANAASPCSNASYSTSTFADAPAVPLCPHVQTTTVNQITYTVSTYPTQLSGDTAVMRVTSVVTWTSGAQHNASHTISGQTLVYSPSGCLSTGTHPFAGPCSPFFYYTASTGQGYISIAPVSGSNSPPIAGISFDSAQVYLPSIESSLQAEQISRLTTVGTTGGATVVSGSTTTSSSGLLTASSQVDSDPSTTTGSAQSGSATQPGGGTQPIVLSSGSANPNVLTLTPGNTDSATSAATVAAASGQGCTDLAGTAITNGMPCGRGASQLQGNVASAVLTSLYQGSTNYGSTPLASVALPTAASGVFGSQWASAGSSYCKTTSGDGCVHVGTQRTIGTVQAGGLPSKFITDGAKPAGWSASNYLFQLSNYSASVSTEGGVSPASALACIPAVAQTATSCTGTAPVLSYWNGSGYTSVNLSATSSPPTITPTAVSVTDGGVSVSITPQITLGVATVTQQGTCSGNATGCTATATLSSPVLASLTYSISSAGSSLAYFTVVVNLGTVSATTTYKPAPSAS